MVQSYQYLLLIGPFNSLSSKLVNNNTSDWLTSDLDESWAQRSVSPPDSQGEECKCRHKRGGVSCWTVIGLIMIDILTLCLLIGGYNELKRFHHDNLLVLPQSGGNNNNNDVSASYLPQGELQIFEILL